MREILKMMNSITGLEKWMMKYRTICLVPYLNVPIRCLGECEGKAAMESDDEPGAAASNGIAKFLDSKWYRAIMQEVFSSDEYRVEGGRLLKRMGSGTYVICILETEVPRALQQAHDSALGGHYGKEVTLKRLERAFWWPSMKHDVNSWVDRCMRCAQHGPRKASLNRVPVAAR